MQHSQAITIYGSIRSVKMDAETFWEVEDLETILGKGAIPSNKVTQLQILCRDYISTSKLLDVLDLSSSLEWDKVRTLRDTVGIYESIRPVISD